MSVLATAHFTALLIPPCQCTYKAFRSVHRPLRPIVVAVGDIPLDTELRRVRVLRVTRPQSVLSDPQAVCL